MPNTATGSTTNMVETHRLVIMLLIFLEKLLLANSKDANVTCIIPDDCILPCSFRPTGTVVIHWYKLLIPVHSYYYNKDQFGLQNKHFSGRTCLFNSHIPHGNASLLLRRVKVQDKGMYKCYTSTRKGNQEILVNLEVKALIQSVIMEMTDETVTCSSHNIYPIPQVTWATDPNSAQEALKNATIKTTDHKGLFTVESTLRILGNLSNYTYFCSFIAADKTQVWTASRKNQEGVTQEEGHALSIPCIAPHNLQNFSLTWTFASSAEPTVILRYDTKSRHTFNLWEGQAELDQDLLPLGDGSLLLQKPDIEEHSGTYTCTLSGLQSRHVVKTRVNITVAAISVDEQSVQRSWWSTAASAAFFLFTITVALPQCVRQRAMGTRSASHRYNGAGCVEDELHKHLNTTASYITRQHGVEGNRPQLQFEAQDELAGPNTAEDCTVASLPGNQIEEEEKPEGPPAEGNDGLQTSSPERDGLGNIEPGLHIS
ncbi:CD276 antigen-like isoform X2 [Sebastes fasciatus]|uniref:CD276 antigen-like isoform X2 n=1 Tax=Sebastes fasciatus TaxID=394691 RepID=UPI003D9E2EBF